MEGTYGGNVEDTKARRCRGDDHTPALLKLMEVEVGAQVTLTVEKGKLVAQPIMPVRKRYSVAELLKGSAAMKRLTAEVAWAQEGKAVGREIV